MLLAHNIFELLLSMSKAIFLNICWALHSFYMYIHVLDCLKLQTSISFHLLSLSCLTGQIQNISSRVTPKQTFYLATFSDEESKDIILLKRVVISSHSFLIFSSQYII